MKKKISVVSFVISFTLSAAITLLCITQLPFSFTPQTDYDLLPYYQYHLRSSPRNSIMYLLTLLLVPFITTIFYIVCEKIKEKRMIQISGYLPTICAVLYTFTIIALGIYTTLQGIDHLKQSKGLLVFDEAILTGWFIVLFLCGVLLSFFFFFRTTLFSRFFSVLHQKRVSVFFLIVGIILIPVVLIDRTMQEKRLNSPYLHQYVHTVALVAPIADVLKGRILYSQTDSQYGFLIVYLFAPLFRIIPLTFTHFFYFMIVLGILYYFTVFFVLHRRFGQPAAFLGLITLFSLHFYFTKDRYVRPMVFPLRYLFDMLFFLLLLYSRRKKTVWSYIFPPLLVCIAILYNFESGIALAITYVMYEIISILQSLISDIEKRSKLKYFLYGVCRPIFLTCLFLTVSIGIFILLVFLSKEKLPNFSRALFYIRYLGKPLSSDLFPIDFYLFPFTIYLVFIARAAIATVKKIHSPHLAWETCLAVYGSLILSYYIQKGYLVNLVSLSIPAILLGFAGLKHLLKTKQHLHEKGNICQKTLLFAPYTILSAFVIFSFIYFPYRYFKNGAYDYWNKADTSSQKLYEQINSSVQTIKEYAPGSQEIALLSFYDTILALKSGKQNIFPYSSSQNVITYSQVFHILDTLKTKKPRVVFADTNDWLLSFKYTYQYHYLWDQYKKVFSDGLLDVWEIK